MKFKKLFEETFEIKISEDKFNKLLINDIKEWDSMGNINLILAIENQYKIKFTAKEIESFTSISFIKKILKEKGIK